MQVTKRQSTLVQDGEPAPKKAEPEAIGGVTFHIISMESYNTVANRHVRTTTRIWLQTQRRNSGVKISRLDLLGLVGGQ